MRYALILACGMLAGCGSSMMSYAKDGATQQQFEKDRYDCIHQATENRGGISAAQKSVVRRHLFVSCMAAKGYREDKNGPFKPSKAAAVEMED